MQRQGRIELDFIDNNIRFNRLKLKIKPRIVPIFSKLHQLIENQTELKTATGSWYVNYCFEKRIIFFKIEPVPNVDKPKDEEGIYISICNEDYPSLINSNLNQYILPKPFGRSNHGNWEWYCIIRNSEDISWAVRLCNEVYSLVKNNYYIK